MFNTDRQGASATSAGRLFQCLTTFATKTFFLVCSLKLLIQLYTTPIHPVLSYHEEETSTFLFTFSSQEVFESNEITF